MQNIKNNNNCSYEKLMDDWILCIFLIRLGICDKIKVLKIIFWGCEFIRFEGKGDKEPKKKKVLKLCF